MTVSERIKQRLLDANVEFHASDNISEYIKDGELEELEAELTEKFESVLDSLIIDPNDPNSADTGHRMAKMYLHELFYGRYYSEPKATAFPNLGKRAYHGMLVVRSDIKSMCSHHHQPVTGTAFIGIIPGEKVIGLSKYSRIAWHCSRRGTLQEELTNDIAEAIIEASESRDVAVYIEASHGCCENRGIRTHNSLTQTTVLHGEFKIESVKKEFFDQIKLQKSSFRCD